MRKIFTAVALIAFTASPVMAKIPVKPTASKLDKVFTGDMIQAQIPYLESVIGAPAWKVDGNERTYKVDGCIVTVMVSKSNDVASIGLALSDTCTFDLNKFVGKAGLPSANKITFGDLDAISINGGRFYGECMGTCGNAADPYITAHYDLPHTMQFLEINADSDYTDEKAELGAQFPWMDHVKKVVGDTADDDSYNCPNSDFKAAPAANEFPRNAFKSYHPTKITIGFQLSVPKCSTH